MTIGMDHYTLYRATIKLNKIMIPYENIISQDLGHVFLIQRIKKKCCGYWFSPYTARIPGTATPTSAIIVQ